MSIDENFASRIQSSISTVEAWDDDPSLLAECRLMIPFDQIIPGLYCENWNNDSRDVAAAKKSPYARDDDDGLLANHHWQNLLFLKRLAIHFQKDVMTWVNAPPCENCGATGDDVQHLETRQAQTQEEREGQASRVEVYKCNKCSATTTFPRYNSCRKLLETKRGRCGEYANLFGLYCRSVGFETRYVSDWTDHVWVEVLVGDEWICADSCEGTIGEPCMYENGWGKKLNVIVATSKTGIVDVTSRYTRQFRSAEFQQRRRQITTSESAMKQILSRYQDRVRQNLSAKAIQTLSKRDQLEQEQLEANRSITEWTHEEKQGIAGKRGRTSGSLQWRIQRNEAGNLQNQNQDNASVVNIRALCVEQMYPIINNNNNNNNNDTVTIEVSNHNGIVVSGIRCDVTTNSSSSIEVVIVDDVHLGCILQSRSFGTWTDVSTFLQTVPLGRIVALKMNPHAQKKKEGEENGTTSKQDETSALEGSGITKRLGGFKLPSDEQEGFVFIGRLSGDQQEAEKWTVQKSSSTSGEDATTTTTTVLVEFPNVTLPSASSSLMLRKEWNKVPQNVIGRLPESIMPLQTQVMASESQKQTAFLSYKKDNSNSTTIVGYTTKESCPVYLMDNTSCFPFQESTTSPKQEQKRGDESWKTYHYLPQVLVPDDAADDEKDSKKSASAVNQPTFEMPLEENFFQSLLGPTLLVKSSGSAAISRMPTAVALRQTRLIGLYFSAHWCPPCKRFTPMLVETYELIKEKYPYHGLEMVFVSSDRSDMEFNQYYGASMPWTAIPFDQMGRMMTQQVSMTYGVRGIPALVILDAVSGQVVSAIDTARNEVMQACTRGGDDGIMDLFEKNWLGRLPPESIELYNLLKMSSMEGDGDGGKDSNNQGASTTSNSTTTDGGERYAYLAINKEVEKNPWADKPTLKNLDFGVASSSISSDADAQTKNSENGVSEILQQMGNDNAKVVLMTMLKYLDNAVQEPWNPKFRQFKLSNKIVDKATRLEGAIDLICSFGMTVVPTMEDFMVSIPLGCNLDRMQSSMNKALKEM